MAGSQDCKELRARVETWIFEHEIELLYAVNKARKGNLSPEFDNLYFYQGRRITAKALAMLINADMFEVGYRFTLSQIYPVLVKFTWDHFMQTQEYPEWMKYDGVTVPKRRPGRPRVRPKSVALNT